MNSGCDSNPFDLTTGLDLIAEMVDSQCDLGCRACQDLADRLG
jgi:hypothetical protein